MTKGIDKDPVVLSGTVSNRDGEYRIEYCTDGVYLSVLPSEGQGRAVAVETVLDDLKEREVKGYNFQLIRQAVLNQTQGVKIAEAQEEVIRDGEVKIDVDRDEMKAYITVFPPRGGKTVTAELATEALRQAGVTFGIDSAQIRGAVEQRSVEKVLVAQGLPAENGKDAKIEYRFSTDTRIRPVELEDGRVDFYNLNMIKNVNVGEILVIRTPPTDGIPGMTVTGKELPAKPGKDLRIPAGKNTQLSDDGSLLFAASPGHVHISGERVNVNPVFELKGDVDFSSGNLNFLGSVVVRGSITYGFSVQCDGDLEVGGSIDGGSVTVGGNLTVRQGILGQHKSVIDVHGNVITRFVENAMIKAGGDVIVGEAIMHSNIDAGRHIMVGGKKGLIVGGNCRAGEEIVAKTIGSPRATATELEVGIRPERRQAYNELLNKLKDTLTNLDKTEKALHVLKDWEKRQGSLPEDKRILILKLTRSQFQLLHDREALTKEKVKMETEFEQMQKGKIRAATIIYPRVGITIGQFSTRVRDPVEFTTVFVDSGEFRFMPYNY